MTAFRIATWKETLSEEEALDSEFDMIPKLQERRYREEFRDRLTQSQCQIEDVISYHLGIAQSDFILGPSEHWIWGSFNVCIPLNILNTRDSLLPDDALIRFPVPFENGEAYNPGNADEKLRGEAATYALLQRDYPDIPIPRLLGMGFSNMQSFREVRFERLWNRLVWWWHRGLALLRGEALSPYFAFRRNGLDGLGYLLLEWVDDGRMLSSSWQKHFDDERRRTNLYRSLSRILLQLAEIPYPRIGSWTMADRGIISLTNRPISPVALTLNMHSITTESKRGTPFESADSFAQSLLMEQENRMRHQRNSMISQNDGIWQLAALAALCNMSPRFLDRQACDGPFILTLPDLHQSNIFVDEEWNISRVIDFEFAATRPLQTVRVPFWLTGHGVEELNGDNLEQYRVQYDRFTEILEAEEMIKGRKYKPRLGQQFRDAWRTGSFWFFSALDSLNAFPFMFHDHLRSLEFQEWRLEVEGKALASQFDKRYEELIAQKLVELQRYKEQIHEIFEQAEAESLECSHKSIQSHGDQSE